MAVDTVTKKKKTTTKAKAKATRAMEPSKAGTRTRTKAASKTAAKNSKTSPATTGTKAAGKGRARATRKTVTRLSVDAVMTPNPHVCRPDTDLGEVGMLLWEADCGSLPVIGLDREILGMITDRDICMSLAMSGARAPERTVAEVMSSPPVCCRPEDEARAALATMAEHRVRRLPVADAEGRLAGIVSMADLVRRAGTAIPAAEILEAEQRVTRPHRERGPAGASE